MMDQVKKHFESEAQEFDSIIIKLIPYYSQMLEALVGGISFNPNESFKVLDLGCGTGTVSYEISKVYPNCQITCLDIAANMIEMAKFKLQKHAHKEFLVEDFSKWFVKEKYNVVVSSLALHHLETDENKKSFYRIIYDCLETKGLFYNADVVLASSDRLQKMYMQKWIQFMERNVSSDEVQQKWIPTYEEEDRPAKLMDQLQWLKDIGFHSVDVLWKYYNFAVYGGSKN